MMMAHDSSHPPPSRLDDDTIAALRVALRQYLRDSSPSGALQQALLSLATEAREKELRAEHVLIVLKDVWYTLPEVRAMADSAEQVRLLQRVVTMCIKEYYSA